jgi:hypothetical protein
LRPRARSRRCSRSGSRSPPGASRAPIASKPRRSPSGCAPTAPPLALIRDGDGTRAVETLLRYRGTALAELMRCQRTLQALQTGARAGANLPEAPPARRRARPRPKDMPSKMATVRSAAGSQDRVADPSPAARPAALQAAALETKRTRATTSARRPGMQVPRRSPAAIPDRDLANAGLAAPRLPLAGTKPTRESAPEQELGIRAMPEATSRRARGACLSDEHRSGSVAAISMLTEPPGFFRGPERRSRLEGWPRRCRSLGMASGPPRAPSLVFLTSRACGSGPGALSIAPRHAGGWIIPLIAGATAGTIGIDRMPGGEAV